MQGKKVKGLIFDIQRFALFDGPGMRTTIFLKGCPLRCPWCHNPEGMNTFPEFIYWKSRCLSKCSECVKVCPRGVDIRKEWYKSKLNNKCLLECGKCITVCPTEAISKVGMEIEVDEVLEIVLSDSIFYQVSNGGVTLSGGEPLFQGEFSLSLLKAFKSVGLHTVLETCCAGSTYLLKEILKYVDMVFVDIKFGTLYQYEKKVHGSKAEVIFENMEVILTSNISKVIRFPCIPTYTDTIENLTAIVNFLTKLQIQNIERFEVLPYNPLGESKYYSLGRTPSPIPKIYQLQPSEVAQLINRLLLSRFPVYSVG